MPVKLCFTWRATNKLSLGNMKAFATEGKKVISREHSAF
jgi:hypothetical protein